MNLKLAAVFLLVFLAAGTSARAQGRGPGGPPGGPGGGRGPMGGQPSAPGNGPARNNPQPESAGPSGEHTRVAASSASLGRWWDDSSFAGHVGISGRQQRRLDSVFENNRSTLMTLYTNLQSQQAKLDSLRAHGADESQLFQQIDRVSGARGDLQKAYAHLQLQIRKELTPEQAARLEEHRTN